MTETADNRAQSGSSGRTIPAGPVAPSWTANCRMRPVPVGAVEITGGLWAARRRVNGSVWRSAVRSTSIRTAWRQSCVPAVAAGLPHNRWYPPDERRVGGYVPTYVGYTLHDSFGRAGNEVMHRLRTIQRKAVGA